MCPNVLNAISDPISSPMPITAMPMTATACLDSPHSVLDFFLSSDFESFFDDLEEDEEDDSPSFLSPDFASPDSSPPSSLFTTSLQMCSMSWTFKTLPVPATGSDRKYAGLASTRLKNWGHTKTSSAKFLYWWLKDQRHRSVLISPGYDLLVRWRQKNEERSWIYG